MTAKKRDQSRHDLVRRYQPGLILNTILGIICELGDPYVAKPDLGGMAVYPSMAMAAVCIMLEVERTTYRKMADILRNNHAMATKMGLTKIPSKSTIARSYGLIPEWYLVQVCTSQSSARRRQGRWQATAPDFPTWSLSGGLM